MPSDIILDLGKSVYEEMRNKHGRNSRKVVKRGSSYQTSHIIDDIKRIAVGSVSRLIPLARKT